MISIPIYFHSDESSQMSEMNLGFALDDCETREMTFYNIDCIAPYIEDGEVYCRIHSSGDQFISPKSYEEIKKLLETIYSPK